MGIMLAPLSMRRPPSGRKAPWAERPCPPQHEDTEPLFQLAGSVIEPVEPEGRLGEVQSPSPGAAHQPRSGADQVSNDRADTMTARPGR